MTSADIPKPTVDAAPRPAISAAGQATFDLALRMGGLFLAIILVALSSFVDQAQFLQHRRRHLGAALR